MDKSRWLGFLTHLILRRRTVLAKVLLTLAWLALAAAVRWMLDRGAYGVPFLTFYPVVLLAGLVLGGRYAILAALVSLLLARFLLTPGTWPVADTPVRAAMFLLYCLTIGVIVLTGHFVRLILSENQRHIDQAEGFNRELQHRSKNALQIMRALIGRGPAPGEDTAEFHAKLLGRMEAFGRANDLLRYGSLESADLAALVATALAPFDLARFRCSGPDCQLHKSAATPLVMALHELATNAVKYGALSCAGGQVSIEWRVLNGGSRLELDWREHGGPPVTPPSRRGMGSRLLRAQGGLTRLALEWNPDGLVCRMELTGRPDGKPGYTAR